MVAWRSKTDPNARILLNVWEEVSGKKESIKKSGSSELKFEHNNTTEGKISGSDGDKENTGLSDELTIDLYRGTDGVIFMVHPGKRWTIDYVYRELPSVPKEIPILVVYNFMDLNPEDRRNVDFSELKQLAEDFNSNSNDDDDNGDDEDKVHTTATYLSKCRVSVTEASLKTCYGLNRINTWMHIPYLNSKRQLLDTILKGTETNLVQAADVLRGDPGETYEQFIEKLENMKQQQIRQQQQRSDDSGQANSSSTSNLSDSQLDTDRGRNVQVKTSSQSQLPVSSPMRYKNSLSEDDAAMADPSSDLLDFYGHGDSGVKQSKAVRKQMHILPVSGPKETSVSSARRPVVKDDDDGYD